MRGAAAPKGAPRRLQFPVFPETDFAPLCRTGALMSGALPICSIYKIWFGCETNRFVLVSPEPITIFFANRKDSTTALLTVTGRLTL
jgi:hypothetical protein